MKTRFLAYLVFTLLLGISRSLAANPPATVSEAVKIVQYGPQNQTTVHSAPTGTSVPDGDFLKTGNESRAELTLPSRSITRLGANTIFNYSAESNTIDLKSGTILFCKPKEGAAQLNIKTAAVTAGIVGTTGVVSVHTNEKTHQTTYKLYLVEGHVTAQADGTTFHLKSGEVLELTLPNKPFVSAFDVPAMAKSPLFTKFKKPLPNQKYIDDAVAQFLDDESRGFIQPPGGKQPNTNYAGIPTMPTTAFDSAQNSQGRGNDTPPPQPPR